MTKIALAKDISLAATSVIYTEPTRNFREYPHFYNLTEMLLSWKIIFYQINNILPNDCKYILLPVFILVF